MTEDQTTTADLVADPIGFERGYTIEHIMLSVTVVHTNKIMQYDDSAAGILSRELLKYDGVERVDAKVLYDHTKTEEHQKDCECGKCKPPTFLDVSR